MNVPAVGDSSSNSSTGGMMDVGEQKDMFLKLLVAQLRNQDPLSPLQDKEFLGQMAQFSSVEQMTNMVTTLESIQQSSELTQAVALIGKSVEYVDADGMSQSATVSAVAATGDGARLMLEGGGQIDVNEVVTVR